MPIIETIVGIAGSPIESAIASKIYETAKKVLEKDPFDYAIERTLDELRKERSEDFFVLEDIYRNRKKIFDKVEIVNETTFQKILDDCDITPDTSSRLFKRITQKFDEIIRETAQDKQEFFFPYAIKEFRNIGKTNEEIVDILQTITQNDSIILEHFNELEKKENEIIHLSRIEYELEKGVEFRGEFFRKKGPLWIDFENDFVVERNEVEEVIKTFKEGCISVLLEGNAASGKSVIARNVGYKLANEKDVYYMSSEEFEIHTEDAIFNDIRKLKDAVIIIEDAHLYPKYCDGLLDDILKNKVEIKILITTRYIPIYQYSILKHLHKFKRNVEKTEDGVQKYICKKEDEKKERGIQEYKCRKITLESFDFAKYILRNYIEKKGLPEPSVKEIEGLLSQSKESLWLLAYFLMAWKPSNPIAIQQIYNNVLDDIIGLKYKYRIIGPEHVIFTIALFYQFEIKVQKTFLIYQLNLNEETIEKLSDVGEIRKSNGYLSLYHSAVAEIYKNASENYSDFIDSLSDKLRNFDENFDNENYIAFLLRLYLRYKPKNYDEVIHQLQFKKEILNFILIHENTCNAIHDLLDKEPNIRKIADVAIIIIHADIKVGSKLVESLNFDKFNLKIKQEPSLETIKDVIRDISYVDRDVAKMIVGHLNLNILKSKIENEDFWLKKTTLNVICYANRKIGNELIAFLGLKLIIEEEPTEKNWLNYDDILYNM